MIEGSVRQFLFQHAIESCAILVAVSGGTDSSALLLAITDLRADGYSIEAAHVNHHLRGDESDADEAFVRSLCAGLGVTLHVADGTLDPERIRARGVEAAAREVRYERLIAIREACGARYVATAHQKNDQAETVLMRLTTGSGLAGLRGIHPVREDRFVRPLLDVTRAEIEAFLRERKVVPRHDRSNDDPRFLRNRVRRVLRELDAIDGLVAVAEQAQQQWPVIERAIDEAERVHAEVAANETRFRSWPDDPWLRQALLHRHIHRLDGAARDVSARDLERLAAGVASARRVSVTKELELIRRGELLVLRRRPQKFGAFAVELTCDETVSVAGQSVRIARSENGTFQLPKNAAPHFLLRNRRPGDRFQPLGMSCPKKLKDFLIDRKIAVDLRDRIPLVVWNGEIVWVAGVEVSERFRITGAEADRYEVNLEGLVADDDRDPSPVQC